MINGFKHGFEIGFQGDHRVKWTAPNLKLNVGTPEELEHKMMKEVKLNRFTGPFEAIPFEHYSITGGVNPKRRE